MTQGAPYFEKPDKAQPGKTRLDAAMERTRVHHEALARRQELVSITRSLMHNVDASRVDHQAYARQVVDLATHIQQEIDLILKSL